ncbi:ABC transporter ATP-binding protein [Micromonospora carbonacea]|uniref:ABC transporter ATP-binding protein n=1 Tax=Micromonospora carbonacea TaxID=47853 RepID=UPI00332FA3B8
MTGPRVDGGAAATGPRGGAAATGPCAGGGATAAADRGTPGEALLVAEDLHRAFGPTPALAGASLTVRAGEVLAVLGPSGSGKSTLLHCLAGIVRPDSGRVRYRGADLTTLSDRELSALRRGQFGFVFQFGQLVPELTCLENVALPLRLERVGRREAERRAAEWLDRLEVTDVAGKRPGEVSGGQGQRVAVARALVTGPRVIFADEPTGALDSLHGERVMRLLTGAARDTGAAVVLVTHEARVAAYSDREVVVRDGRTRSLEAAA